jgi:hypothetical protein
VTFLTPLLAGIAAAIAVPSLLILYFLKLRRRDLEISSTLLWKKAIQDLQANAPFQKLRRNILLILQLIILAAALFALGQPQIKGHSLTGQKHILLVDRSASMASVDCDPISGPDKISRLDRAKAEAIEFINTLREPGVFSKDESDEAMLIVFDSTADVRVQFTSDKATLKSAIEEIQPVEGPGSLKEAVRLAKAHAPRRIQEDVGLTGGDVGIMHLWSDGRLSDAAEAATGPEDRVLFHRVGSTDATNLGIVSIRAERAYDNPSQLSIFVAIENTEKQERAVDAELFIDGQAAGLRGVRVPGAQLQAPETQGGLATLQTGTGGVVFQIDRSEGALAQVRLRQPALDEAPAGDVLAVDDRAWIVVPPARRLATAVVTGGNLFIRTALEGLPLAKADVFAPAEFQKLLDEGKAGEYDVVILDGWLPAVGPDQTLPPGRWLVLNALPKNIPGVIEKPESKDGEFVQWNRSHPALRAISLDNVHFARATNVELEQGAMAEAIAWSDQGPVMLDASGTDWRALITTVDVGASDWGFQVSFVVYLAMSINYLGDDSGGRVQANLVRPGEVLADRLPPGATAVEIEADGAKTPLQPARDGRVTFGPVKKTGVLLMSWSGQAGGNDIVDGSRVRRAYAANLMDSYESNVPASQEIALAGAVVGQQDEARSTIDRKLWPFLILAALGVMVVEWFIYNRKVHV